MKRFVFALLVMLLLAASVVQAQEPMPTPTEGNVDNEVIVKSNTGANIQSNNTGGNAVVTSGVALTSMLHVCFDSWGNLVLTSQSCGVYSIGNVACCDNDEPTIVYDGVSTGSENSVVLQSVDDDATSPVKIFPFGPIWVVRGPVSWFVDMFFADRIVLEWFFIEPNASCPRWTIYIDNYVTKTATRLGGCLP